MIGKILLYALVMIALLLIMLLFYYLFNLKNIKKQKEHFRKLHNQLNVGKQVVFMNGIYGTLVRVDEATVDIKVKSGHVMEVSRFAISEIIDR